jgi:hypothetical protein
VFSLVDAQNGQAVAARQLDPAAADGVAGT